MKIAVINSGSSSIKFKLFDTDMQISMADILVEKIGEFISNTILKFDGKKVIISSVLKDHHDGLENIIKILNDNSILNEFSSLDAIGHRVVHGGEKFSNSTVITEDVIRNIKELIPLAPLHNKANLEGILVARKKAPFVKQIAVFDTAFHSGMPKDAYLYALDLSLYEKHNIRRYGFHGTSYSYILKEVSKQLKKDVSSLNIIALHLGNGASACCIKNGKSIDTSMGFTPLEGLVMGTRCGDIDAAIVLYMQRELEMGIEDVDNILNKKSGLYGICADKDVRNILESDDQKHKLAIDIMVRRVKKYIGSYMTLLDDIDAVVFTGGIGENSSVIRDKIMNTKLFENLKTLVIKTDEELEIANECVRVLGTG